MLDTRFTELVGCRAPIHQAGMGGVATPELAAAVADAGALGMVNMVMMPADAVEPALDALVAHTSGAVGMNFLMPFIDLETVEIAASRMRVVEFFYGQPDPVPAPVRDTTGNVAAMALYAGRSVGAVTARCSAADVVRELAEGAEQLLRDQEGAGVGRHP